MPMSSHLQLVARQRNRIPHLIGVALLATPLILGSPWAFLPLTLTVAVVLLRTALEDRTLHAELDGYHAYAGRVRYRLFPGLW